MSSQDHTTDTTDPKARSRRKRTRLILGLIAAVVFGVPGGYYLVVTFITGNFHAVVPGEIYRSRQPKPGDLTRWTEQVGLQSVLCLRGDEYPQAERERAEAAELGLDYRTVRSSAHRQLSRYEAIDFIEQIEQMPKPLLIHCRAGADRTGTASVIAAMAFGGQDYAAAIEQMHWQYLHVGWYKVKVDKIFDQYERWCQSQGVDTGGWEQFRRYIFEHYYPRFYHVEIDVPERLTIRAGESLTLDVPVTVRASEPLPGDDDDKRFALACFEGEYEGDYKERLLSGRVDLPRRSIAPGETVTLEMTITLPADEPAGVLEVGFDVEQVDRLWFGRMGNPVPRVTIEVLPAEGQEPAARPGESAEVSRLPWPTAGVERKAA